MKILLKLLCFSRNIKHNSLISHNYFILSKLYVYAKTNFRENVPIQAIFDLLKNMFKDKYYLIDNNSYKRMIFNEYHTNFDSYCYYQNQKILRSRKCTYNSFVNIVRQAM